MVEWSSQVIQGQILSHSKGRGEGFYPQVSPSEILLSLPIGIFQGGHVYQLPHLHLQTLGKDMNLPQAVGTWGRLDLTPRLVNPASKRTERKQARLPAHTGRTERG